MFGVTPYRLDALEALPTNRLLGYLRRLRRRQETLASSDVADGQRGESDLLRERIYFVDDPRWFEHVSTVKALLRVRPHLKRRASPKPRRKKAQAGTRPR